MDVALPSRDTVLGDHPANEEHPGMRKQYDQIAVGELTVDPNMDTNRLYMQRDEVAAWTDKIINSWDVEMLLPALISKRADGAMVIIDGQHSNQACIHQEGPGYLRDAMV